MKKILILLFIGFLIISCDNEIEPYSDYQQNIVVYGILSLDTNFQSIAVLKNYSLEEYNNPTITNEIEGAKVRVYNDTENYTFVQTKKERKDKDRYKTEMVYYTNSNFKPNEGTTYNLLVELPDGKKLKSSLITPRGQLYYTKFEPIIPTNTVELVYNLSYNLSTSITSYITYSRLYLHYNYKENNVFKRKVVEIPSKVISSGSEKSYYFAPPDVYPFAYFDNAAVKYVLSNLNKADTTHANYQLIGPELKFFIMEKNLGRFVLTNTSSPQGLSVILDTYDYSNIEGGLGVFGSYVTWSSLKTTKIWKIFLDHLYIKNLGYATDYLDQY